MDKMFEQLDSLLDRYAELQELMSDPEVINETSRYMELSKEEAGLREIVGKYTRLKTVLNDIAESEELLRESNDPEMEELAKADLSELQDEKEQLEQDIKILMLPTDPNDEKNIIMEIRGAAGGDEASLFAGDLLNMYQRYAESQNWQTEIIDETATEVGGFKEVAMMITGKNVYSKLKYENGAHRVQRIPKTESQGRVHTSTATVAVMPEYDGVDVQLDPKDIRTDVYRASGAGGQHINKTSSAVRLTHLPTGIVVSSQAQRSQLQNRETAMNMLKAKLYQKEQEEQAKKAAAIKGEQLEIGWGSQIRSYVFHPYTMVKDHRTNYETGNGQAVMDGDLDPFMYAYLQWQLSQKNPN